MAQSLLILGRQPQLGLAELESLFGAEPIKKIGPQAALVDIDPTEIDFNRLGGSIKMARVIGIVESVAWPTLQRYCEQHIIELIGDVPAGKLKLGFSAYGQKVTPSQINATALALKKILRSSGLSVRIIPNKTAALGSAQVLYNQLTADLGREIIFVADNGRSYIAQTVSEQDIDDYAARDQQRPKRDARVGMLPPKLAQIIVNLATATTVINGAMVLDPFCGTGVVLQEALLMGAQVYGTDLEPRMIEYSKINLEWLTTHAPEPGRIILEQGDATKHTWKTPITAVAAETYLGRPFSASPEQSVLRQVVSDVDLIHRRFLENLAKNIQSGTRICIAVPAWRLKSGFVHLPTLDHLEKIGYTRVSFAHTSNDNLIYYRDGQFVGRELVVIVRK